MRRLAVFTAAMLLPVAGAAAQTPNPIDCANATTTVESTIAPTATIAKPIAR